MRFNLAQMWQRAASPKRREAAIRPVSVPATLATDIYRQAYLPVIALWERAAPRIMERYKATLAQMTDSAEDIGAAVDEAEREVMGLLVTVRASLDRWATRVEAVHRTRWQGAVLTATGVDLTTLIGPGDMREELAVAMRRNADLIANVSSQTKTAVTQAVFSGLRSRTPAAKVAKEISNATGMARKRAKRIAADQTVKITASLNDERRRQAGASAWEWVHSGKVHYRPEHRARNGKRYDDDAKAGERKPPADRPGQLPYCGCTSRAIVIIDEEDWLQ